jgi:hypothetical protein
MCVASLGTEENPATAVQAGALGHRAVHNKVSEEHNVFILRVS